MTERQREELIHKMANISIRISSLRHGIENAAWEEARGKLMAYLRLRGSCFGGDQEEYDALKDEIENFINRIDEGDIYSPDPDEITRLREENARLREALKPFSALFLYPDDLGAEHSEDIRSDPDWDDVANGAQSENVFVLRRDIRRARAAILERGKNDPE